MTKFQKKIIAAGASTLLFLQSALPVLAVTTIQITGNGSGSTNNSTVDVDKTTVVTQSNTANVKNDVTANADTGENNANRNTGGNVSVDTGNADVDVAVSNDVNSNVADVDCGGCSLGDIDAKISGNGEGSTNKVDLDVNQAVDNDGNPISGTLVDQNNHANIKNIVDGADADTGENNANRNTGGNVSVDTGNATSNVDIVNKANSNSAVVGGGGSKTLNVEVSDNGAGSGNTVNLDYDSAAVVNQTNKAHVYNKVDADAETGENNANKNTGGSVTITTGNAKVNDGVRIANLLNSNSAMVGSGGGSGASIVARITGNGADSTNLVDLDILSMVLVGQENKARVHNYVDADAETGENSANSNTGGTVLINTGDAKVKVVIDNMMNFNWADVDCGCLIGDVLAKIAGNGSPSKNTIKATLDDVLAVDQTNACKKPWFPWPHPVDGDYLSSPQWLGWGWHKPKPCLNNEVYADADTGDNLANSNGGGVDPADPSVTTGDADTYVDIDNSGNSNVFGQPEPVEPEWPFTPGFWFNLNISLDFQDLLNWFGSQQA